MFHVKICGVRLMRDIEAAEQSAADAVGLNFFPPSPRFVDPTQQHAVELAHDAKARGLKVVGVFVNDSVAAIEQIGLTLSLDGVQLHGDETIHQARALLTPSRQLIRALKLPLGDLTPDAIDALAGPWIEAGVQHLILDADGGRGHGGSGRSLDWSAVRRWGERHPGISWTLAGGLTPDNVEVAIATSGARSVDVASGVEAERGIKSPALIERFVKAAWRGMNRLPAD